MTMGRGERKYFEIQMVLATALVCVLAFTLWLTVYRFDNKYTMQGPKGLNGKLVFTEEGLADSPLVFLVDGWEYYEGKLLSPDHFAENPLMPDQHIFVGRFGGFEGDDKTASPHGSASYRLNVEVPAEIHTYMLELPEIFSVACM